MNPADITALVAILFFTFVHAFFTLAETALITVRQARLEQIIVEGRRSASALRVQDLMREPTRVFAAVQVGITLASFSVASIGAAIIAPHIADVLYNLHVPHGTRIAVIGVTLAVALFTLTIGELVPRAIALRHPDRIALSVARPLRIAVAVLSFLATIALALSNLVVKPFGMRATFAAPLITEDELRALLEASAQSGAIEEEEKEIIRNVISFGDTDVRQVMTPRTGMTSADVKSDLSTLVALIVESGHSRIAVYEENIDNIVGVVHAKDLLPILANRDGEFDLHKVARVPLIVPENKRVDDLLQEFRVSGIQMAIVQDEYGGTAGLVTIEDLLEELVGEIRDEYDEDTPSVTVIGADESVVDGLTPIDDLNEQMGLDLPHDDYDTIGGFVFGLFGRQPEVGESICHNGVCFVVEENDGRRIGRVRLMRGNSEQSEREEAGTEA
jgi:putative hemolysin